MRNALCLSVGLFLLAGAAATAAAQNETVPEEQNFYTKSLHYTNRGIEFVYSKEHGGIERLTGLSATEMGCLKSKCHVRSCDTCHKKDIDGRASYSIEQARHGEACNTCHPMEEDNPDVHFKNGMKCMDCHSSREIHGDGVEYDAYMQPGFFDTKCENCHAEISKTASHTVHGERLDCSVCHVKDISTCFNCHIDTRLAGGKDTQIERQGLLFLVNHDGKVTLANVLSYVYGNKTMITVAPTFSHKIIREGRTCDACHGTTIVHKVKKGSLDLFEWRKGEAASPEGVIPVVEGMKWKLAFLGREGDKWIPLTDPEKPLVNFSGFCTPLTPDQLTKLEHRQTAK